MANEKTQITGTLTFQSSITGKEVTKRVSFTANATDDWTDIMDKAAEMAYPDSVNDDEDWSLVHDTINES